MAIIDAATGLTGLAALIWFGMWMGLWARNGRLATINNVVFVQLLPMLLIGIASGLLVYAWIMPQLFGGNAAPRWMEWLPAVQAAVMALMWAGKDLFFFLWSRKKLHQQLRDRAARTS